MRALDPQRAARRRNSRLPPGGQRERRAPLALSTDILESILLAASQGARNAEARFARAGASCAEGDGIHVSMPTATRLCELDPLSLFGGGEVIAGVSARVTGQCAGSTLLALDPESALSWVGAVAPGQPPLEAFVRLGAALLEEIVGSITLAFGHAAGSLEAPRLEERPTAAALVATNAPSDTETLALPIEIAIENEEGAAVACGAVYLLVEPKTMLVVRAPAA